MKKLKKQRKNLTNLKIKVLTKSSIDQEEKNRRIATIELATTSLKWTLLKLRKKFTDSMVFVSRARWFEYDERSNKFFLNLIKSRQNQKLISKIRNNEKEFVGQDQVSRGISDFYQELYSAQPTEQENEDNFYENCPKLSEEQTNYLDSDLTLKELQEAMSTSKESSPGPDGIPYSVYKKYWKLMGPIILKAWKHSLNTGNLPPSHLDSVVTILPKDGKDTKDIKNWRPKHCRTVTQRSLQRQYL